MAGGSSITVSDWLLIVATVCGPIAAVQAQKWIERGREKRSRRLQLFQTLMSTRAIRAESTEHVQALNLIELFFVGRGSREKSVRNAWTTYLDFLQEQVPSDENAARQHNERGIDRLVDLLGAMGRSLGFDFNAVQLKRGIYYPRGHANERDARSAIRDGLVGVLTGKRPIPMEVTRFHVPDDAIKMQQQVQQALLQILSGDRPLWIKTESQ
jgi:hypothetical protein